MERFDDLTDGERQYLAMHARYESERENDPRYWTADRTERERLKARWREIADAIYPAPWGNAEPIRTDFGTL